MKVLRGTPLDPFGRNPERRLERRLIAEFEADMAEILPKLRPETMDLGRELARLPLSIRGFGPVKEGNAAKAALRREELLGAIRAGGAPLPMAAE
jgi:indolepyruvate ferredoxin oxidoreductase